MAGRMLRFEEALGREITLRQKPFGTGLAVIELPGAPGSVPAVTVEKPPWQEKPPGGWDFDEQNIASVVLPAIGTEVTVVQFTVPRGANGVIERIANQFVGGGWTEGTGDLVWRIEADAVPFRNYQNIIASLGSQSNPGRGRRLRVFENQIIRLVASNVAVVVAAQPLLGLLGGWFYPIEQEGESYWL